MREKYYPSKHRVVLYWVIFISTLLYGLMQEDDRGLLLAFVAVFALLVHFFYGTRSVLITNKNISICSKVTNVVIPIKDIKYAVKTGWDSKQRVSLVRHDSSSKNIISGIYNRATISNIILSINKSIDIYYKNNSLIFSKLRTNKESIKNTRDWKSIWKEHLNVFDCEQTLKAENGLYVLNSLDLNDISSIVRGSNEIKVMGFIQTPNNIFYMTKINFEKEQTQWVYVRP